jgi:hypothetical protein
MLPLQVVVAILPELLSGWHSTMLVCASIQPCLIPTKLNHKCPGTYSLALAAAKKPNGGADGSMLVDADEVLRGDNNGLQTIVGQLLPLPKKFNVSAGDVLHVSTIDHAPLHAFI